jgi:hypothetical protein
MLAIIMCIIQLQLKHKIELNLEAEKHQAQNRQNHQALIFFLNNKETSVFPNAYVFC